MKDYGLIRKKGFMIGFAASALVFVALNFAYSPTGDYSLDRGTTICFDCYESYGFPFVMHENGTILHLDQFVWSGVVANLSIAIFASVLVGLGIGFGMQAIYRRMGFPW